MRLMINGNANCNATHNDPFIHFSPSCTSSTYSFHWYYKGLVTGKGERSGKIY